MAELLVQKSLLKKKKFSFFFSWNKKEMYSMRKE